MEKKKLERSKKIIFSPPVWKALTFSSLSLSRYQCRTLDLKVMSWLFYHLASTAQPWQGIQILVIISLSASVEPLTSKYQLSVLPLCHQGTTKAGDPIFCYCLSPNASDPLTLRLRVDCCSTVTPVWKTVTFSSLSLSRCQCQTLDLKVSVKCSSTYLQGPIVAGHSIF